MEGNFERPTGESIKKRLASESIDLEVFRQEALPKNKHEIKHLMYELSEILIEHYHIRTQRILQNNPETALDRLQRTFLSNREFAEALMLDDGVIALDEESLADILDDVLMRALESEVVFPSVYMGAFSQAFSKEKRDFDPEALAVYRRLDKLLHTTQVRGVVRMGSKREAQSVEGLIKSGVVTAATESWSIIVALVKKYNQEFDTALTSEQLDVLTPDIKRVLNQIASLNIADLGYLRDLAVEPGEPNLHQVAWDKILVFSGDESRLELGIRDEYQHLDTQERERKECTVGCPARGAVVTNAEGKKTNVIGEVFEFHKDLAKRVMLPHQRVLTGHTQGK